MPRNQAICCQGLLPALARRGRHERRGDLLAEPRVDVANLAVLIDGAVTIPASLFASLLVLVALVLVGLGELKLVRAFVPASLGGEVLVCLGVLVLGCLGMLELASGFLPLGFGVHVFEPLGKLRRAKALVRIRARRSRRSSAPRPPCAGAQASACPSSCARSCP